jgi:hypothetical protein
MLRARIHLDPRTRGPAIAAALASALLAACGSDAPSKGSGAPLGSIATNPDTGMKFIVDSNQGGNASGVKIRDVLWGRLVDVYDRDPATGVPALQFIDFLIDPEIQSDGSDFLLETQPVTAKQNLTILHAFGTAEWDQAFARLEQGLQPFITKGFQTQTLPPYTELPRNAAMVVIFDDLLEDGGNPGDPGYPATVTSSNVQVRVGYPPIGPFELRVLPDRNHGDLAGGKFHTTRVLLDMTVSKLEAVSTSLPVNQVGLPEAVTTGQPNVALRIPTKVNPSAAQFDVLQNLSAHPVAFNGNGPNDPTSPTLDVVRAFRSGGKTLITGDPYNGFLQDDASPKILGSQTVAVDQVIPFGSGAYALDLTFAVPGCSGAPRIGDVIQLTNAVLEVTQAGIPPSAGKVTNVMVRLVAGSGASVLGAGGTSGEYGTVFDPATSVVPECFVKFSPSPLQQPNFQVPIQATVHLSFSEPMDPASVQSFDTFLISKDPVSPAPSVAALFSRVVGQISGGLDLTSFAFQPSVPLKHVLGQSETYFVRLLGGSTGLTDLAGNALALVLPTIPFTIDPNEPTIDSGGLSLTFDSVDEDGNGPPELRGGYLPDLLRGTIRPRPVTRFSAVADSSQITVAAMGAPFGLLDPLSRFGSRLMTVWRYHDLGFPLFEEPFLNIDVEGLHWSPSIPALQFDIFPQFQIGLAHSKKLPDEFINTMVTPPAVPFPLTPGSGLNETFADNLAEPLNVVHPKQLGYIILPSDLQTASTGLLIEPWPLNRNVPLSQFQRWTWRDTANTIVGGPNSSGADTFIMGLLWLPPLKTFPGAYAAGSVPTLALPLLMDFRAYPNDSANGLNGLLAANASVFAQPYFRAFSTGGILPTGIPKKIDPDQQVIAVGGLTGAGIPTPPLDNSFYYGQADFVVRVSQVHSIWFDLTTASNFGIAVVEPSVASQPSGTSVSVAFRGATAMNPTPTPGLDPWESGQQIDPYGNAYAAIVPNTGPFTPNFVNSDPSWKHTLQELNGARFVQARITLVSNAESGVSPEISALGIPFFK